MPATGAFLLSVLPNTFGVAGYVVAIIVLTPGASAMGAVFAFGVGTSDFGQASPTAIANGMWLTFAAARGQFAGWTNVEAMPVVRVRGPRRNDRLNLLRLAVIRCGVNELRLLRRSSYSNFQKTMFCPT